MCRLRPAAGPGLGGRRHAGRLPPASTRLHLLISRHRIPWGLCRAGLSLVWPRVLLKGPAPQLGPRGRQRTMAEMGLHQPNPIKPPSPTLTPPPPNPALPRDSRGLRSPAGSFSPRPQPDLYPSTWPGDPRLSAWGGWKWPLDPRVGAWPAL